MRATINAAALTICALALCLVGCESTPDASADAACQCQSEANAATEAVACSYHDGTETVDATCACGGHDTDCACGRHEQDGTCATECAHADCKGGDDCTCAHHCEGHDGCPALSDAGQTPSDGGKTLNSCESMCGDVAEAPSGCKSMCKDNTSTPRSCPRATESESS
jgi:hypothetical protein